MQLKCLKGTYNYLNQEILIIEIQLQTLIIIKMKNGVFPTH